MYESVIELAPAVVKPAQGVQETAPAQAPLAPPLAQPPGQPPVAPPTPAAPLTEEALAAAAAALLLGAVVPPAGMPMSSALGIMLLGFIPTRLLKRPEQAAQAALIAARFVLEAAPSSRGVTPQAPKPDPQKLISKPSAESPSSASGEKGSSSPKMGFSSGPVGRSQFARELLLSIRYGINAGIRLAGMKPGNLEKALKRELNYYRAHRAAQAHRTRAAAALDNAVGMWGDLLSWRAVLDERTTPDCRAVNNKNFRVSRPPRMGLPGMVHALCRCVPGPPIPGAAVI